MPELLGRHVPVATERDDTLDEVGRFRGMGSGAPAQLRRRCIDVVEGALQISPLSIRA